MIANSIKSVVMGLAMVALCGGAEAEMVTLQHGENGVTVKDGHIRQGNLSARNFGGATTMQVGGIRTGADPQERFGFVEFNNIFGASTGMVPLDQAITSATLRLHIGNVVSQLTGSPVQDKFRIHASKVDVTDYYGTQDGVNAASGEMSYEYKSTNTLGWGSAETGNSGPVYDQDYDAADIFADLIIHTDDDGQWAEWDVTAFVQGWQDNENSVGGFPNYGIFLRNVGDNAVIAYFDATDLTSSTDPELVVTFVPEPASAALLATGILACLVRRRNRVLARRA